MYVQPAVGVPLRGTDAISMARSVTGVCSVAAASERHIHLKPARLVWEHGTARIRVAPSYDVCLRRPDGYVGRLVDGGGMKG
jgi:hypothetical protein